MNRSLVFLRGGSFFSRFLPLSVSRSLAEPIARHIVPRFSKGGADQLRKNLSRVSPLASSEALDRQVRDGFASYARYWVESLKIPFCSSSLLDDGFSVTGFEHLESVRAQGFGPILALPHLGGWEWGAAWLHSVKNIPVSAVVERLSDSSVFDWFVASRESYGIEVIPLGSGSMGSLVNAVKSRNVVCLLSDRDIAGTGVEVDFFGEVTTLPVGPALLSFRTGSPILPTAVYFDGSKRICRIGEPLWPVREAGLRADLQRVTQTVGYELERLIRRAPDQWHVLSPNWPSDR